MRDERGERPTHTYTYLAHTWLALTQLAHTQAYAGAYAGAYALRVTKEVSARYIRIRRRESSSVSSGLIVVCLQAS